MGSFPLEAQGGTLIQTESIHFNSGEHDILPSEIPKPGALVSFLQNDFQGYLRLVGHTDAVGDYATNDDLSQRCVDFRHPIFGATIPGGIPSYSGAKG